MPKMIEIDGAALRAWKQANRMTFDEIGGLIYRPGSTISNAAVRNKMTIDAYNGLIKTLNLPEGSFLPKKDETTIKKETTPTLSLTKFGNTLLDLQHNMEKYASTALEIKSAYIDNARTKRSADEQIIKALRQIVAECKAQEEVVTEMSKTLLDVKDLLTTMVQDMRRYWYQFGKQNNKERFS